MLRARNALAGLVAGLVAAGLGAIDTRRPVLLGGLFVTYAAAAALVASNPHALLFDRGSPVAGAFTAASSLGALALAFGVGTGFAYAPALLGLGLAWLGFAAGVSHAAAR